jgi:hypothetical protein
MSPRRVWEGAVAAYVVGGTIWSGLLQAEGPPRNAPPGTDRYERWRSEKYRHLKRVWIWAAGLALLLTAMMAAIAPE